LRVIRRPKFLVDLDDAYRWIARDSPAAGERLLVAIRATVDRLIQFPMTGTPRDAFAPGLRSVRVRPFQHLIFYQVVQDQLMLIRLFHGARSLEDQDYKL
jgi:plasmid stabilization system protein ParE